MLQTSAPLLLVFPPKKLVIPLKWSARPVHESGPCLAAGGVLPSDFLKNTFMCVVCTLGASITAEPWLGQAKMHKIEHENSLRLQRQKAVFDRKLKASRVVMILRGCFGRELSRSKRPRTRVWRRSTAILACSVLTKHLSWVAV